MIKPRDICIVIYSNVLLMDISGPLQVFSSANQVSGHTLYNIHVVSQDGKPVVTDTGVTLSADYAVGDKLPKGDIIIPGGPGVDRFLSDKAFVDAIRHAVAGHRRIISICSGSMVLAEAGILTGKSATCHWKRSDEIRCRYPQVNWLVDRIFIEDGNIFTSAGCTAGIDLALYLLELDMGREFALDVARELVVFMRRSGNQSQYSRPLRSQSAKSPGIRELCEAILDAPDKNWTLPVMGSRVGMTERSLHRYFKKEFGETPSAFVENVRLESAKMYLQNRTLKLEQVARKSGFKSEQTLRRVFVKNMNITPVEYRQRFS